MKHLKGHVHCQYDVHKNEVVYTVDQITELLERLHVAYCRETQSESNPAFLWLQNALQSITVPPRPKMPVKQKRKGLREAMKHTVEYAKQENIL